MLQKFSQTCTQQNTRCCRIASIYTWATCCATAPEFFFFVWMFKDFGSTRPSDPAIPPQQGHKQIGSTFQDRGGVLTVNCRDWDWMLVEFLLTSYVPDDSRCRYILLQHNAHEYSFAGLQPVPIRAMNLRVVSFLLFMTTGQKLS